MRAPGSPRRAVPIGRIVPTLAAVTVALLLAACGSGGSSSPTTVSGTSPHGSTPTTAAATGTGGWSAPVKVDALTKQGLRAISCPSSTFCVAIDTAGNAFVYSSGTWSSGTNVDSAIPTGGTVSDQLLSVSCASSTYCVAGDSKYNAVVYNGTTWSQPQQVDTNTGSGFFSVSCPTTTFCMAVDGASDSATYNGTSWSTAAPVDPSTSSILTSELTEVSCASPSFCVTMDGAGHRRLQRDGVGHPQTLTAGNGGRPPVVPYVSCASATLCVGAGSVDSTSEYLATYSGSSWSGPLPSDHSPNEYDAVSCVSGPYCLVLEAGGKTISTTDGSSWTKAQPVEPSTSYALPTAVSCASSSFCMAVDNLGYALVSKS